jgi:hypothetical protein
MDGSADCLIVQERIDAVVSEACSGTREEGIGRIDREGSVALRLQVGRDASLEERRYEQMRV